MNALEAFKTSVGRNSSTRNPSRQLLVVKLIFVFTA